MVVLSGSPGFSGCRGVRQHGCRNSGPGAARLWFALQLCLACLLFPAGTFRRKQKMNIFMLLLIGFMSIVGGATTLYVVIGMPAYLIWKFIHKVK